jgi:ABC-type uncharacterized transport system permease subunit
VEQLATVAFYLGVIAYSAASTLFFLELVRGEAPAARAKWATRLLAGGAVLHTGHVVTASLLSRVCPVESLHFGLSFSALIAVAAFLLLKRRFRLQPMGAFVGPIALTFLVGAQFVGASGPSADVPRTLLALHIAANVIGVGLFLIAGILGVAYVVEERRLKRKRASPLTLKLPPLDALDRATYRLLLAGFPLLTFGVVTGSVFSSQLGAAHGAELIRSLLGYATWLLVAAVLVLRRIAGWRGRRAAWGTLAGVGCVLLVIALYIVRAAEGA